MIQSRIKAREIAIDKTEVEPYNENGIKLWIILILIRILALLTGIIAGSGIKRAKEKG